MYFISRFFSHIQFLQSFHKKKPCFKKCIFYTFLYFTIYAILLNQQVSANDDPTSAAYVILIDVSSGAVLYEKNADSPMPPASMAKLMTVAVVFNLLKEGKLALSDQFVISENAWRNGGAPSGGSTMYAKIHSHVTVENLLRAIIIQSANDASIAIAEGIAGDELAFAKIMNEHAQKLGLKHSSFHNSTGLPDDEQYVSARDLAYLALYLINKFPEHYSFFSEKDFTWNNIRQRNRNPLLQDLIIKADGLKTGYTRQSGYGMVASARVNGRHLIAVINGLKTAQARTHEMRNLLLWGGENFEAVVLSKPNEPVVMARVYGGAKRHIGLVGYNGLPVHLILPRDGRDEIEAKVIYKGPIKAPIQKGQPIGTLYVLHDDKVIQSKKLYAAEAIEIGSLPRRALDAISELLIGWL